MRHISWLLLLLLSAFLFAGCRPSTPGATASASPTILPSKTGVPTPTLVTGLLYFLTYDNGSGPPTVEALDAGGGANRWWWNPNAAALAAPGAPSFSPLTGAPGLGYIAGNGAVYVWYAGNVTALNVGNGSQQWQVAITQSGAQPGVMVVN